jgi:hypothetical protein
MSEQEDEMEVLDFTTGDGGESEPWKIGASQLKNLRGMIIDRDKAWRANAEMAGVINGAILKGIKNIDRDTYDRIYQFLRHGGLPGSYETYGFDEQQMRQVWRDYLPRYYRPKPKPKVAAESTPEPPSNISAESDSAVIDPVR